MAKVECFIQLFWHYIFGVTCGKIIPFCFSQIVKALVSVINKQTSRVNEVIRMVRYMVLQCLNLNILFKANQEYFGWLPLSFAGQSNFKAGSKCSKGTNPCAKPAAATELLECIGVLTQAALAPSTQNTYRRAWATFESFSVEVLGQVSILPRSVSTISLFVAYMIKKSFSPSTISTYLSALGYVHKMLSFPDNTRTFLVDKLVTGANRLSQTIDTRLLIPILNKMLLAIPVILNSHYEQWMLKAMFLLHFQLLLELGN